MSTTQTLELVEPIVQENGLNTNTAVNFGSTLNVVGLATFNGGSKRNSTPIAVNSSGTLTAAQVAGGYITSTSASAVTMTMPTGTLLGTLLGATQGTTFDLYIDNTAGANTVTMAVGVNAVQADYALQITAATASVTPATVTPLTIRSGVAGTGLFKIVFSSATAYTFSRVA